MKHKNKIENSFYKFLMLLLILSMTVGCSSRYRMSVHVTSENGIKRTSVKEIKLINNASLNNPYREEKLIPGDNSVAIIELNFRGQEKESKIEQLLSYDENVRLKLFLQISHPLKIENLTALDNSFAQLLEHFELPADEKMFIPKSGGFFDRLTRQ